MNAEALERSPHDIVRSEIFSARDELQRRIEEEVEGYREIDIERRVPGAGSVSSITGQDLIIKSAQYSDTLVLRTSQSAYDNSTRTHEKRILTRSTPDGSRTVMQFDITYKGEPTDPYGIAESNQVGGRVMLIDPDGNRHLDSEAIARVHLFPELFSSEE